MKQETREKMKYYTKYARNYGKVNGGLFWQLSDNGNILCLIPFAQCVFVPVVALADLAVFPYRLVRSHEMETEESHTKTR